MMPLVSCLEFLTVFFTCFLSVRAQRECRVEREGASRSRKSKEQRQSNEKKERLCQIKSLSISFQFRYSSFFLSFFRTALHPPLRARSVPFAVPSAPNEGLERPHSTGRELAQRR